MASDEETLYCICRQSYEDDQFMIECEVCKDWFHGSCVGIKEHQAADIEIYHCPNCQPTHGPLCLKKRRNWHRRDYSEDDDKIVKAVQTGTVVFVQELKQRIFPSADDIPIKRLRGYELTKEYLEENGFTVPILIEKKDGLDIKVPPPNFSIQDVENHVGSMREIAVIDVAMQEDYKMLMREWTEYYTSPNRTKIYNVISLEFTQTKLAEMIEPPRLVTELSWVSQYWPEDQPPEDAMYQRPEVQRYCLMGVKDSFTDFHIDFGGTSVWYHVLRGEKVFYLIRPTSANLALYETWLGSSGQSELFFGDQVDACYKCVVKQGQTLFIPTGWIHAVLTPIDSLVFGGNFLHSLGIELQIQVYEIEKRVETESKYLFPNYETVNWYASKHILDIIRDHREENTPVPQYLVNGARSLAVALKSWTHKKDYIKKDSIPETIQYGKLLKDLNKELKLLTPTTHVKSKGGKKAKKSEPEETVKSGRKPKTPKPEPMTENPFLQSQKKSPGRKPKQGKTPTSGSDNQSPRSGSPRGRGSIGSSPPRSGSPKGRLSLTVSPPTSPLSKPKSPKSASPLENTFGLGLAKLKKSKNDEKKMKDPKQQSIDQLKMRIPKFGAYTDPSVYDFMDEPEDESPTKLELRRLSNPLRSPGSGRSSDMSPDRFDQEKVSGLSGNEMRTEEDRSMVSESSVMSSPPWSPPTDSSPALTKSSALKLKVSGGKIISGGKSELPESGKFQLLSPSSGQDGSDTSENEDSLVVDETPRKRRRKQPMFGLPGLDTSQGQGPLKLKLSVPAPVNDDSDSGGSDRNDESYRERLNMPMIRGGLNGSISDILEASGYGTETDFKTDEDIKYVESRASPTMRDAIQGMLSMSRIGMMSTLVSSASPSERSRVTTPKRMLKRPEGPDKMPTCFKDEEFVYPTLDVSDQEDDHVFKPRGKPRKDETWNPKAKLNPNCPKPERPHRENSGKEAVQSGLAAAAAKYAHLPPPKRQYVRRKPKPEKKPSPEVQPSTSSGLGFELEMCLGGVKRPAVPVNPAKNLSSVKKPKKGMATAKQRLGKILKMHKMKM